MNGGATMATRMNFRPVLQVRHLSARLFSAGTQVAQPTGERRPLGNSLQEKRRTRLDNTRARRAGRDIWLRLRDLRTQCKDGQGDRRRIPRTLGLGRREPETGHLEVFRADSAQQFCKRNRSTETRGQKGPPFRKESLMRRRTTMADFCALCVSVDFGGAGASATASVAASHQRPCPVNHAGQIELRNLAPVGQHRRPR